MPIKKLHPILVTKLPSQPAPVADLMYATREARYEVQKAVAALEEQESKCRDFLINNLPKSKAGGITGRTAHAEVYTEPTPQVDDWSKFTRYIQKTGAFELLTRALGKAAIKERWDDKKQVPGIKAFNAVKISLTKKSK